MSDDGVEFVIDLPVKGQSQIDAASASVDTLAGHLDNSTRAISAAEKNYSKAEQAADGAAKALERVGLAADMQRAKLQAATDMKDTGAAERAAAKLRDLVTEQQVLTERAAKAKTALEAEAASLDKLKGAAEKTGDAEKSADEDGEGFFSKFDGLDRSLHKIGGPLADVLGSVAKMGEGFGKLSGKMGGSNALMFAGATAGLALVAAVVAAGVALAEATIKIGAWAVGLADANRSAGLLAQGIARSVAGGNQLDDKITSLTKTLPLTREELTSTAQKLADAGLRGQALTNALQTSATAAAKLKFGPEFSEQMLSLDEQTKVFHENIAGLFGGLKIEGLLQALQKLVGLFDETSASGRAIKVVFESIFQPLVDGVTAAEPKIERFFLQLEILAMKAMIAIKPYGSTILKVGEAFGIVAALIGGVVVGAIALALAPLAWLVAQLTAVVYGLMTMKDRFLSVFHEIGDFISNFSLADMAKNMIDGLVHGIENGGAAILSAMTGAVKGAVDGVKKYLGIASPSKLLEAEVGVNMGAGVEKGVDKSADGVQSALQDMVAPPATSGAGAAAPSAPTAKSGGSVSGNTFILNGVQGADDAVARIGALLTQLVEGDVAQLGGAVPSNA